VVEQYLTAVGLIAVRAVAMLTRMKETTGKLVNQTSAFLSPEKEFKTVTLMLSCKHCVKIERLTCPGQFIAF
jgi:S-adenosylmethionine:tRNA-ribosyltransferase-isomerase (queuine synthetase)